MSGNIDRIILFDGVCNLCNGYVQFIIKRDTTAQFRFGTLQGNKGDALLNQFNLDSTQIDSVIYIRNGKAHIKSKAVLLILKDLSGLWSLFYPFIILPKPIRDFVYDIVARNRYRWFGKKSECMIPNPELEDRFID